MLTRSSGYLTLRSGRPAAPVQRLQTDGYVVLKGVFDQEEVAALCADIERVFDEYPPDERGDTPEQSTPFRYEMLNRSGVVQGAIAHPRVLHVIANTAWRQPPGDNEHLGRFWHIDSGPHIPRRAGVPWDARIPYPVFVIATHLYLWDCPIEAGPTGVIPGSHTSGQAPPLHRVADDGLEYEGRGAIPVLARAGDVALFVSDIWHRRMPPLPGDPGRMFVQCHYGRRDIAQRLQPTSSVNHLSAEAVARARTPRERTLAGLHPLSFYDG
jgi:ectoine hydroxylase-related dioxygenase (phytanoyl-CoA dioxygenase family)